ncbi:hypothetical protein ACFE04_023731 [Oxalis oulophora]
MMTCLFTDSSQPHPPLSSSSFLVFTTQPPQQLHPHQQQIQQQPPPVSISSHIYEERENGCERRDPERTTTRRVKVVDSKVGVVLVGACVASAMEVTVRSIKSIHGRQFNKEEFKVVLRNMCVVVVVVDS